jgi:hypothetical protein
MIDLPQPIQSEFNAKRAILCGLLVSAGCFLLALHDPTSAPTASAPTAAPVDLTGKWEFDYSFSGSKADLSSFSLSEHGSVCLIQQGDELTGAGQDQFGDGPEQFKMTGDLGDGNRVNFSKAYLSADQQSADGIPDQPISFEAKLLSVPGQPVEMTGTWSKRVTVGHFLAHRVVTYRGEFRAHRVNGDRETTETTSESSLCPNNHGQLPGTTL